jgi:chromosome segregation ATPase
MKDDTGLGKFILDKLEKIDDKLDQVKIEAAESRKSFDAHEAKDEDRHKDLKKMHESIDVKISDQNKQLSDYNFQLKEHIRRTELLEEVVKPVLEKHTKEKMVSAYLTATWTRRIKILTVVSLTVGIIATLVKVFLL